MRVMPRRGRGRTVGAMGTTDSVPARSGAPPALHAAKHRYAVVLTMTLVLVVFVILAPGANWSRAAAIGLEAATLVVVLATSREHRMLRRARALAVGLAAAAVVAGVAAGLIPAVAASAIAGALAVAIPLALLGGLARLVRTSGVTLQAVAGALAIYLLIGLTFAWLIGFASKLGGGPYFTQGTNGTESSRLYFSFAALTTTGFGDLTPAAAGGRALAVVEMLSGQIYLVTVIGVLVGSIASGRR
jgi:Ion channel